MAPPASIGSGQRHGAHVKLSLGLRSPGKLSKRVVSLFLAGASLVCIGSAINRRSTGLEQDMRSNKTNISNAVSMTDSNQPNDIQPKGVFPPAPLLDYSFGFNDQTLNYRFPENKSIFNPDTNIHSKESSEPFNQPHLSKKNVEQGLSNCGVVSAITSAIIKNPDLAAQLLSPRDEHSVKVSLSHLPESFNMDLSLPMSKGQLVYSRGREGVIGVPLIEKALAIHFKGYPALFRSTPNQVCKLLTGGHTVRFDFDSLQNYEESEFSYVVDLVKEFVNNSENRCIVAGTAEDIQGDYNKGLYENHSYAVDEVLVKDDGSTTVILTNPHFGKTVEVDMLTFLSKFNSLSALRPQKSDATAPRDSLIRWDND